MKPWLKRIENSEFYETLLAELQFLKIIYE